MRALPIIWKRTRAIVGPLSYSPEDPIPPSALFCVPHPTNHARLRLTYIFDARMAKIQLRRRRGRGGRTGERDGAGKSQPNPVRLIGKERVEPEVRVFPRVVHAVEDLIQCPHVRPTLRASAHQMCR